MSEATVQLNANVYVLRNVDTVAQRVYRIIDKAFDFVVENIADDVGNEEAEWSDRTPAEQRDEMERRLGLAVTPKVVLACALLDAIRAPYDGIRSETGHWRDSGRGNPDPIGVLAVALLPRALKFMRDPGDLCLQSPVGLRLKQIAGYATRHGLLPRGSNREQCVEHHGAPSQ